MAAHRTPHPSVARLNALLAQERDVWTPYGERPLCETHQQRTIIAHLDGPTSYTYAFQCLACGGTMVCTYSRHRDRRL